MKRFSDSPRRALPRSLWVGLAVLLLSGPTFAAAQDAAVVKRLRNYGQLSKRDARAVVRDVEARLSANADRGGDKYDTIRQAIGEMLFPGKGPGRTMEIYRSRHAQVILQLYRGLDEPALQGLFGPPGAAKRCRRVLGMDGRDCATLVAAARLQPVAETAPAPSSQSKLSKYLTRARSALGAGQLAAAEKAYVAITRIDPSHAMAFAGLGLARAKQGNLKGAIQAYETAVSLAPNLISLQVVLGRAYKRAGRKAQARASFEQALVLDPGHAEAQRQLRKLGGRMAPTTPSQKLRAKAQDQYRAGRYAKALASYQRAADKEPGYPGTYAGIGACHLQLGDPDAAVRAYQMATQLKPNGAGLHAALGRALSLQGQHMSARVAFRSALSIDPNNKSARIGLAKLTAARTAHAAKPSSRFPKYNGGWSPTPPAAPAPPAVAPAEDAPGAPAEAAPVAPAAPAEGVPAVATPDEIAAEPAAPAEPEPVAAAAEDSLMAGLLADPLGDSGEPPPVVLDDAPAPMPVTPSRDQISTVMRGLSPAVQECVGKSFHGVVKLSFTVAGNTGEVMEGAPEGEMADTDKGQCVTDALMAAKFPLFSKDVLKIKYPMKL